MVNQEYSTLNKYYKYENMWVPAFELIEMQFQVYIVIYQIS